MHSNRPRGRKLRLTYFCAALFSVAVLSAALPAQTPDKKEIVKQARQTYYSLKTEGLAEFHCAITPNWQVLLTEQKVDADTVNRVALMLNKIHFSVSMAAGEEAKVTHNEISAENEQQAKGLSQIYSGMEQMTSGFFQTWSIFTVTPALPEVSADYQVEKTGAEYRLTYKEGTADNVIVLNQDFAISSLNTVSPEFNSTIRPQFIKTAKGFLMTGYQATYLGKSDAEATELQIVIDYQAVATFQLPQKLDLKGTYGGSPFHVEVTFSDCHARRR